jgi:hypothetical protein
VNPDDLIAPHCDQYILHAPGECDYCDDQPGWQALRQLWGIAYTGHAPTAHQIACPSDTRRPDGIANLWHGNQAQHRD